MQIMKYCVTAAAAYFQHVELYAQNACIVVDALRCARWCDIFRICSHNEESPVSYIYIASYSFSLHVENVDEYFSREFEI